ncbi:MAG: NAD(P)H-dependent oxidoreductase subunit E [Acidobacteriota bacterium]
MIVFSSTALAEYEQLRARYPSARAALLPILWLAQREFQVITPAVADYLGALLGLSGADVYSVASFYTMLNKQPVGRYHLQVCHNVTCFLGGCERILAHLKTRLAVTEGNSTLDGRFSLISVECLGACDLAPVIQINEHYYGKLTPTRIDEILAELERDEKIPTRDTAAA